MRSKIKLDKVNGKLESGKAGELLSTQLKISILQNHYSIKRHEIFSILVPAITIY